MEELLEYYINDYAIFEEVLKRDYYSVLDIINEQNGYYSNSNGMSDEEKEKIKLLGKAEIYNYVEKLLDLVDKIKKKVQELLDKLLVILDERELKKWTKKIEDNKDLLINTDFKDFKLDNYYPDKEAIVDLGINIKNMSRDLEGLNVTDEMINDMKDRLKKIKEERKTIHDEIWWNKVVDYTNICKPYYLLDQLELARKNIRTTQKFKKDIMKYHEDIKRDLKKSRFLYGDLKDKESMNMYRRYIQYINLHGSCILNNIKTLIVEQKNVLNWYKKTMVAVLAYAKKQSKNQTNESSIDMDYINAVSESILYELS